MPKKDENYWFRLNKLNGIAKLVINKDTLINLNDPVAKIMDSGPIFLKSNTQTPIEIYYIQSAGNSSRINLQWKTEDTPYNTIHQDFFRTNGTLVNTKNIDNEFDPILIHPNPFNTSITIKFIGRIEFEQVSIRDLNGRNIFSQEINSSITDSKIDLMNINPGLYFVEFVSGNKVVTKKIIKY